VLIALLLVDGCEEDGLERAVSEIGQIPQGIVFVVDDLDHPVRSNGTSEGIGPDVDGICRPGKIGRPSIGRGPRWLPLKLSG
jgi:hypothetical protein